ncbi:hypothetical protein X975_24640, partial [Stegodyphus mimosarum]
MISRRKSNNCPLVVQFATNKTLVTRDGYSRVSKHRAFLIKVALHRTVSCK